MSKMKELQDAMIAAMKAKDKFRKDAISVLVSAAKKSGIDAGCREDIPDDMVNAAVLKELKSCKEQIDTCPESREDLLEEYKKRYEIMSEFAPKQMDAEEVTDKSRNQYQRIYFFICDSLFIGITQIFHCFLCITRCSRRKSCDYRSIRFCFINIVLNILKMSAIRESCPL